MCRGLNKFVFHLSILSWFIRPIVLFDQLSYTFELCRGLRQLSYSCTCILVPSWFRPTILYSLVFLLWFRLGIGYSLVCHCLDQVSDVFQFYRGLDQVSDISVMSWLKAIVLYLSFIVFWNNFLMV